MKWGDVFRFASGNADLPGNGGAGRVGFVPDDRLSRERSATGSTRRKAKPSSVPIEFGPSAAGARCTLGYGNSSQPGSPHLEDQLPLMVQKKLHPVWRERKDIEANLEKGVKSRSADPEPVDWRIREIRQVLCRPAAERLFRGCRSPKLL